MGSMSFTDVTFPVAKGLRYAVNPFKPKAQSGLRHQTSPSAFERSWSKLPPPSPQPLAQQPLRYRAGDNLIAGSIAAVIENSKIAAKAAKRGLKRGNTFTVDSSPRKKARDNLAMIDSVLVAADEQKARHDARAKRKHARQVGGERASAISKLPMSMDATETRAPQPVAKPPEVSKINRFCEILSCKSTWPSTRRLSDRLLYSQEACASPAFSMAGPLLARTSKQAAAQIRLTCSLVQRSKCPPFPNFLLCLRQQCILVLRPRHVCLCKNWTVADVHQPNRNRRLNSIFRKSGRLQSSGGVMTWTPTKKSKHRTKVTLWARPV